jgi:thiopeptide-type bacteriocin biosynthesis protein
VEPLVLHPLALEKQAPPLARFLAMLGRGSVTAWTAFDWGPAAVALPFLPRIRYRRTILAPARWKLSAASLPAGPFTQRWHAALTEWAATWHHPSAVLAETATADELGWIGHAHEITMPLAAAGPQMPHPDLISVPLVTNQDLPRPGDAGHWLQAKVLTHPTAMDQIITRRLPDLLEDLGTGDAWFVRYRSLHEPDHLRIRVPAGSNTLKTVAAWTKQLTADRLASDLVVDGYRPETGRYGTGPAMEAAEAVFVADSLVTRYALTDLPHLQRGVVCALSMIDLAEGFLGTREAWTRMATVPAPRSEARPEITRPTIHHVRSHPLLTASARLASAVGQRRAALGKYRACIDEQRTEQVLESLLHMHHNRMTGPDRAGEAASRHAARQACRSLTARGDA